MPFRLSVRSARTALLAAILLVAAACKAGDSGPTLQIQPSKTSLRPYETLTLGLGAPVTDATMSGTLGAQSVTAARINDSTFSLVVPPVAPGSYELHLATAGGASVTTQVTVLPEAALPNPAVTVDSVAASVEASITAVEASFIQLASDGVDTLVTRQQLTALRAKIQSWRADLAAASPEERRQVAAFFAANQGLSLSAFDAGTSGSSGALLASSVCQDGVGCVDEIEKTMRRLAVGMAIFAGGQVAAKAASWLGGLASKITVEGVQIVAAGVLLGYVANGIGDIIRTPLVPEANSAGSSNVIAQSNATAFAGEFVIGTASALNLTAEYSSLKASDLTNPAASKLAVAMKFLQDTWVTIASAIPFVSLPTPSFPAVPARKVIAPIPPAQLSVTSLTPTDFTVTTASSGTTWMLNFANPKAGDDHPVGMTIKFSPPGLAQQTINAIVLVRPALYTIASVLVAPGVTTVPNGGTKTLTAFARDTTGDVIPVENLVGRMPVWTTSHSNIATVVASGRDGIVTGVSEGDATITATAGGKQGQAMVTVEQLPLASRYSGTGVGGGIGNEGTCQYYWTLNGSVVTVDYDPAPPEGASRSVTVTLSGTASRIALLGSIDAGCPNTPVPYSITFSGTATGFTRSFKFEHPQVILGWELFRVSGYASRTATGDEVNGGIAFSPGYGGEQPVFNFKSPARP